MESERTPLVTEPGGSGSRWNNDGVSYESPTRTTRFKCYFISTLVPVVIISIVIAVSIVVNHNYEAIVPDEKLIAKHPPGQMLTAPMKLLEPIAVPVIVESGTVSAGLNGATPTEQWSGGFPRAIPLTLLSDLTWNGTVTSSTADDIVLKGNFTVKQWSGQFAFLLISTLPKSLQAGIISGTPYTSKIFLRDKETALLTGNGPLPKPVRHQIFVVLEGFASSDKMALNWWGDAILMFPNN